MAHPPSAPDPPLSPALALLAAVYPPHLISPSPPPSPTSSKPFVTLTYAQSLDGCISGRRGKQLILSGEESMRLTHRLRELHDSILVGVGTVLNDDPQLTARLPTPLPLASQPRPLILDSRLRTPADCKLLRNAQAGVGREVTVLHAPRPAGEEGEAWEGRRRALEEKGAELVEVERD
ncbi:hypothetical protein JCM10207_005155, partial [Rhodosporidiobolus poonsookiae]